MVNIRECIVVEGRYDKNTLAQIVNAPIVETSGFGIFKDKDQQHLLRQIAAKRGLIVFTDSDGAGFVIRNFLKGLIPASQLKHAYIPDISGKERRKASAGKEGLLGVEGMTPEIILQALRRSGATIEGESELQSGAITKQDFMALGLSGGAGSSEKRARLMAKLGFPKHMSSNALLQAVNLLYTLPELQELAGQLEKENG
ncbi:MAG: DUF4093 domain-containing protein [Oscillospiraceae bacterium]|nr:DUF4093 domain-containing protein [Oscillospiraceae bacterium]